MQFIPLALHRSKNSCRSLSRTAPARTRSLSIDPQALSTECGDGFAYLEFRDQSRVSHDLEAATQEFTSRGEMVRKLVDHKQGSRQEEQTVGRALQLALDAFDE